ncbi:hypothetical protein LXL04_034737 [Taraxacum kok-saghyz]
MESNYFFLDWLQSNKNGSQELKKHKGRQRQRKRLKKAINRLKNESYAQEFGGWKDSRNGFLAAIAAAVGVVLVSAWFGWSSCRIGCTTSKRLAEKKVAKFEKNITKRGLGPVASKKIKTELYVLAFFIVVVVGSYCYTTARLRLTKTANIVYGEQDLGEYSEMLMECNVGFLSSVYTFANPSQITYPKSKSNNLIEIEINITASEHKSVSEKERIRNQNQIT